MEYGDWCSGDCLFAPDRPGLSLDPDEIIRRIAVAFRRVAIDRDEGDRWVEARVSKAIAVGYRGGLLEAEEGLRGRSVLVSVGEQVGDEVAWVRFFMTPDTGTLELHYEPAGRGSECRVLAGKLAEVLRYEFSPREDDGHA